MSILKNSNLFGYYNKFAIKYLFYMSVISLSPTFYFKLAFYLSLLRLPSEFNYLFSHTSTIKDKIKRLFSLIWSPFDCFMNGVLVLMTTQDNLEFIRRCVFYISYSFIVVQLALL